MENPSEAEQDNIIERHRKAYQKALARFNILVVKPEHAPEVPEIPDPVNEVVEEAEVTVKTGLQMRRQKHKATAKVKTKRSDKNLENRRREVEICRLKLLEYEDLAHSFREKEVNDMLTVIHAGSRYHTAPVCSQFRDLASSHGFSNEELKIVEKFGSLLLYQPEEWSKTIDQNIRDSMFHMNECIEMSDKMVPGTESTYAELNYSMERMLNSMSAEELKRENFVEVKGWAGGTLGQWIEEYKDHIVSRLQFGRLVEPRLTKLGRRVLRGIMKRVAHLHEHGMVHLDIGKDTIIVSADHEIFLTDVGKKNQSDTYRAQDCTSLRNVIKELIGSNPCPRDVQHLLNLLMTKCPIKKHDLIFSHTCLWSPNEMMRNIYAFRMMPQRAGPEYAKAIADKTRNIPKTETDNWVAKIPRNSAYETCYKFWQKDIAEGREQFWDDQYIKDRPPGLLILFFLRNCLEHAYEATKEEKDKGLVADQKSALEVEAEIFIIFPTFMCYFMEHVMKDGEELAIWKI